MANTKSHPMPGDAWRFNGDDQCPAVRGLCHVTGLRWKQHAEALFHDGTCAGVEHTMTSPAWIQVVKAGDS